MGYTTQNLGTVQTWTPTYTGFSTDPSGLTGDYFIIGKWCFCTIVHTSDGTSNATTLTFTLPVAAANTATQIIGCRVKDNGTIQTAPGMMRTQVNSNVCDVFKTLAAGAFTNSGNKNFSGNFFYETV